MTVATERVTPADLKAATEEFQGAMIRLAYAVDGDERHPGTAPRTPEALARWRTARDERDALTARYAEQEV